MAIVSLQGTSSSLMVPGGPPSNLILNGTFSSGTTNWTESGNSTLAVSGGQGTVTDQAIPTPLTLNAVYQAVTIYNTTNGGKYYRLKADYKGGTGDNPAVTFGYEFFSGSFVTYLVVSPTINGQEENNIISDSIISSDEISRTESVNLRAGSDGGSSGTAIWDNIELWEYDDNLFQTSRPLVGTSPAISEGIGIREPENFGGSQTLAAHSGPQSTQIQVNAVNDDGYTASGVWTSVTSQMNIGNSTYDGYVIFRNVALTQGQTVPPVRVKMRCSQNGTSTGYMGVLIKCENADTSTNITSQGTFDTAFAARTTEFVWWTEDTVVANDRYSTPDFSPVIQVVVDRLGWSTGNDITVFFEGAGIGWAGWFVYPSGSDNPTLFIEDDPNISWLSYTGATGEGISSEHDIYVSAYNMMRNQINRLYGTGSTDFGYGETTLTIPPTRSSTNDITSDDLTKVRNVVNALALHVGAPPTVWYPPTTDLAIGDIIFGIDWDELKKTASQVQGIRFNLAAGEFENVSKITDSITTQWGVGVVLIDSEATVTFTNANDARFFFNSGGRLEIEAVGTNPVDATQDTNWQTLLSTMGRVSMNHTTVVEETGSGGTTTTLGFYDLTTAYQTIYTSVAGTGAYTSNEVIWYAKVDLAHPSAKIVTLKVEFRDYHPNTWTDDTVDLDITLDYYQVRANNVITAPNPTWGNPNTL